MKIVELAGKLSLFEGEIVGIWVEQIVLYRLDMGMDGLGFIRIWATLPRRLVVWDGAPSPSALAASTAQC